MRLGCIALIFGAGLTFLGGQKIYETWNSGKLQTMSYDQFVKAKPGVGWYKLTDASWHLIDAPVLTGGLSKDVLGDLYIPVRKSGEEPGKSKIEVLLHRENLKEAIDLSNFIALPVEKQISLLATDKSLDAEHPVSGMIEFGIDSEDKQRDALNGAFGDELSSDYVVITDGAEPGGYGGPLLALFGGLVILAFSFLGLARSGGEVTDD